LSREKKKNFTTLVTVKDFVDDDDDETGKGKRKKKGKSMDLLSSSVERDGIKRRRQRRGQKNLFLSSSSFQKFFESSTHTKMTKDPPHFISFFFYSFRF
jgi:hypothetical protein